jgi:hypothetical protein
MTGSELVAEVESLRRLVAETNAALTRTQARSTEQCNELRGLRRLDSDVGFNRALLSIVGAAYAAICKHGPFIPRLLNIPDGTGGGIAERYRDFVQGVCTGAERDGGLTWRMLAEEEAAEVFAETDPEKLRAELAQLGAVVAAWMQAISERKSVNQGCVLCEAPLSDFGCDVCDDDDPAAEAT